MAVLGLAGSKLATADFYTYRSVIFDCTGTCASFASLDVGTRITGKIDIELMPDGIFGDAENRDFTFMIFNPALPRSGPVGDPVNDNPLIFDSALGTGASNGTAGTTDVSRQLNGGQVLLEFLEPPFSSNEVFLVFDLSTGDGQLCLFFVTAGCIPGATQFARFKGQFGNVAGMISDPQVVDFGGVLVGAVAQADVTLTNITDENIPTPHFR